jgi:glycerophosphoryl diester phosphodiesterase
MKQRIIGHRGARNLWPENSLAGFRKVLELGVDGIELDVHPSAAGELVVIHDPTLERTTEGSGPVAARTAAELRATRLKNGEGEGVPSFGEVLDVIAGRGLELHIELKKDAENRPYPGLEKRIVEALASRGLDDAILTCFDPLVLAELRRVRPRGRLLASVDRRSATAQGGPEAQLDRFAEIGVDIVAVEKSFLAEHEALYQRRLGPARLGAWVVNEPPDIERWVGAPVQYITSDRPDLVLAARARL